MTQAARATSGNDRLQIEDIIGGWHRSLLIDVDGTTDADTEVNWLQGPASFVDLRQPAGRPDFSQVRRAADLTPSHTTWMSRQAGFAGVLVANGEFFEWRRRIDLQPPHSSPDAGTLYFDGDVLIEKGWYESYVEHWNADAAVRGSVWALQLASGTGAAAILVRVGTAFGWARALPTSDPRIAVEIALGIVTDKPTARRSSSRARPLAGSRWVIDRSSLPFREGSDLRFRFGEQVTSADLDVDGTALDLTWTITTREGETPV